MIFKDCYPAPALHDIVQVYRLRHFILPGNLIADPKPYPTRPEQCMTFYIKGFELTEVPSIQNPIKKARSVITGQYTGLIKRYSGSEEFLMVQVVFLPGVLHRMTGIPSLELQNKCYDLEEVMPKAAKEVNKRLEQSCNYETIIETIENFLLAQYNKCRIEERPADQIFRLMLQKPATYPIDWLAKEACLSPRQFERKAYDYVGVSPKLFSRISRFIQSYDLKLKNKHLDWLSIAITCNYHDYQHLVKDYKEFAAGNPNDLFAAESKALERRLGLIK
jgi:AraC-like DNA-binding protein